MADQYDVVVVGARCAGSTLAALLAGAGLRVCALDQAEFPSDTLSTHLFQVEGIRVLERIGALDRLLATGAPPLVRAAVEIDGTSATCPLPARPGDRVGALCVRRPSLDAALVDTAGEAGVEIRTSTRVVSLIEEEGRVTGVETDHGGRREQIRARLVVGADGRNSTVARLAGARRYNVTASQRVFHWAYFDGAPIEQEPTIHFCRRGDDGILACPTDSGAYMVAIAPSADRRDEFADLEAAFPAVVTQWPDIAGKLERGTRIGRVHSVLRFDGFFRDSAGPGWALVGDAGHFKDPTPGQGISDAFRQSETLAKAIVEGLGEGALDDRLTRWWRWRDEDAFETYWFAYDLGRAGVLTPVVRRMLQRIVTDPALRARFIDIFSHRERPSEVLSPERLLRAAGDLLVESGVGRGEVLREVKRIVADDRRRKRLARNPEYEGAP